MPSSYMPHGVKAAPCIQSRQEDCIMGHVCLIAKFKLHCDGNRTDYGLATHRSIRVSSVE